MMPAVYETTSVKSQQENIVSMLQHQRLHFEGFRLIYTEAGEEKDEKGVLFKGTG